jgi:5-methylcytosine-specific restriction protein A
VTQEDKRVHEVRRTKDEPWRKWYHRLPWTSRDGKYGLRRLTLTKHPICNLCKRNASTVADHIVPHKGDWSLFIDEKNLQGICKQCHDQKTVRENA